MVQFGFYASLEEYAPATCLEQAVIAEETGFDTMWVNDHYNPWFDRLSDGSAANNGDCWSWMPAALERTDSITIGTGVTAILQRHHPADIAQSLATLLDMYPERVFLGIGTGEPLNESPLGYSWLEYGERARRTAEAIRIIRHLFENNFTTHNSEFWTLKDAALLTGPDEAPPIYVAGSGSTSARMAGDLGDGFLTVRQDPAAFKDETLHALDSGIKKSDRNDSREDIEKVCLIHCAYDEDESKALERCKPWRPILLPVFFNHDISDPRYMRMHGDRVSTDTLYEQFLISSNPSEFVSAVEQYVNAGFDQIVFRSSSPDQAGFCRMIRDEVMNRF